MCLGCSLLELVHDCCNLAVVRDATTELQVVQSAIGEAGVSAMLIDTCADRYRRKVASTP